jgi:hypothetical protein
VAGTVYQEAQAATETTPFSTPPHRLVVAVVDEAKAQTQLRGRMVVLAAAAVAKPQLKV